MVTPTPIRKRFFAAAILCLTLTGAGQRMAAQQAAGFNRSVYVAVREPADRLVTGLEQAHFAVFENGAERPIKYFADSGAPVSIAIVGEATAEQVAGIQSGDELIRAQSLGDALQKLASATNVRKALVLVNGADAPGIPGGIQVLKSDAGNLSRTLIEVHNSYMLGFSSSNPGSMVEVTLKPPAGLPRLTLTRN